MAEEIPIAKARAKPEHHHNSHSSRQRQVPIGVQNPKDPLKKRVSFAQLPPAKRQNVSNGSKRTLGMFEVHVVRMLTLRGSVPAEAPVGSPPGAAATGGGAAAFFTVTLAEAQRVAALAISGTMGGDSSAVVLDVDAGAVADLAGNDVALTAGAAVAETADSTPPACTEGRA